MSVSVVELPASAVAVTATGELDAADESVGERLLELLEAGRSRIVVDLLQVTFIDSSVIRALVMARHRVPDDGWLRIVYTHHLIGEVLEICGLTDLFPQHATAEAAVRGHAVHAHDLVPHDSADAIGEGTGR